MRTYLVPHPTQHHTLHPNLSQILRKLCSLLVLLDFLNEPIDVLDATEVRVILHPFDGLHDLCGRDDRRIAQLGEEEVRRGG